MLLNLSYLSTEMLEQFEQFEQFVPMLAMSKLCGLKLPTEFALADPPQRMLLVCLLSLPLIPNEFLPPLIVAPTRTVRTNPQRAQKPFFLRLWIQSLATTMGLTARQVSTLCPLLTYPWHLVS